MSSRIRSDFGTLGSRVSSRRELPCHVWVDGGPGVLVSWERRADGWWGRCLVVDNGIGTEVWVTAERLRPAEDLPAHGA